MAHENKVTHDPKRITIVATAAREISRREELQAIRREMLALAEQAQVIKKRCYDLAQRIYVLTDD